MMNPVKYIFANKHRAWNKIFLVLLRGTGYLKVFVFTCTDGPLFLELL